MLDIRSGHGGLCFTYALFHHRRLRQHLCALARRFGAWTSSTQLVLVRIYRTQRGSTRLLEVEGGGGHGREASILGRAPSSVATGAARSTRPGSSSATARSVEEVEQGRKHETSHQHGEWGAAG